MIETIWDEYSTTLLRLGGEGFEGQCAKVVKYAKEARADGGKVIFIGNGGSAAIANHMAADWQKAGKIPAMSLTEASAITALSNDLAYDKVFTEQIHYHGRPGDLLFAISSSGNSANIVEAALLARAKYLTVITLSGFKEDNPLQGVGHVNFHVPVHHYGLVEVSHLAIIHHILDRVCCA